MKRLILLLGLLFGSVLLVFSQEEDNDYLRSNFLSPSDEARPRVWWHWMNGNISKDGIRKDLLWMKRAGIAGFHNFDAGFDVPLVVEKRLAFMSDEWKDAFNYTLDLADSLGLEVSIASSAGWSVTGGPWVSREDAMKKLVWVEMTIDGGKRYKGPLPKPYNCCGEYQDIRRYIDNPHKDTLYRDVAVVAVKIPSVEKTMDELSPRISASDQGDCSLLMDGDRNYACVIEPDDSGYASVLFDFGEDVEIKAFSIAGGPLERNKWNRCLEYSNDGLLFTSIMDQLPHCTGIVKCFDIEPTKARYFRIRNTTPGENLGYTEIEFHTVTRVNVDTEKAGFFSYAYIRDLYPTPRTSDAVSVEDVIDITSYYKGGELNWRAPKGKWRIYRFGYSLTGKRNGPASPEATGLEVDKLDSMAVKRYYENYLSMYDTASNHRLGKVIRYLMIDSYEARCQTWTAQMPQEFLKRRGYSLIKWLPSLTGRIISSSEETERFLHDWRITLGELMAECHYDAVNEVIGRYGLKRHTESHEYTRAFVGDGMDVKRKAHIPMSAFWVRSIYASDMASEADIRESASVCHIYGQKICAAESFTADAIRKYTTKPAWSYHPGGLKPCADAAIASGLNRFIIHCSTHQPEDSLVPGLALSRYGQWFTRKETWAEEAKAWTDYLSRTCAMMQEGEYVADIAYLYAETQNATSSFKLRRPSIPQGYSYDFVNKTIINNILSIDDNELEAPTGAHYKALVLDEEVFSLSIESLRSIRRFADAGVLIVGNPPIDYADLQGNDSEFLSLKNDIWNSGRPNVRQLDDLQQALLDAGIEPDLTIIPSSDADIRFVHRRIDDGEVYWVANITPEYRTIDVSLRCSGLKPELWHADTGVIENADYVMKDGRTIVRLNMVPDDAVFIVMRERTIEKEFKKKPTEERVLMEIKGPWTIEFQENRGAPAMIITDSLKSFTDFSDDSIKYFSGTAVYCSVFNYEDEVLDEMYIALGDVKNMARVTLNGQDLGLAWKIPYRLNISSALKRGRNELCVKVINSWTNRLIGDLQPGAKRICYTPLNFFEASDPLLKSGLIGPISIGVFLK